MDGFPTRWNLSALLKIGTTVAIVMIGSSGCAWRTPATPEPMLPSVLPPSPSLEQVIQAVNQNSQQIRHFSTDVATLSSPGIPTLRANIAFERPMRLRFRAGTGMTGSELDLGSNDELFWVWVKRQPPLYYARHDQFASSPARRMLPVEPTWLVEAFGITEFDPGCHHEGPRQLPNNRLEIRTLRNTPEGTNTKLTIVDASTAAVLEQHLYDCQGQLVASAKTTRHRRDPLTALVMPRIVEITCPSAQFSMRVDLGNVEINRFSGNPADLWTMPSYEGWPTVDLGDPNLRFGPDGAPIASRPNRRLNSPGGPLSVRY